MIGWVAGSCLFGLGCLGLKVNGTGPIFFDLQHSLHSLSLSPACSVHGRKLYRFPFLNLAPSLLIDLLCLTFSLYHNSNPKIDSNFKAYRQNFGMGGMASLVDDIRRSYGYPCHQIDFALLQIQVLKT